VSWGDLGRGRGATGWGGASAPALARPAPGGQRGAGGPAPGVGTSGRRGAGGGRTRAGGTASKVALFFLYSTRKEYARGDVHENRAECLFSLLKLYLQVFRGVSKCNLPGYVGFFQCLRNFRLHNACEQAEMILYAALDPSSAHRARKGEFVSAWTF
jgi:hypothetical protein